MPTTLRSIGLRLVLVLIVAAGTGACSLLPPGTVPVALNPVLVTYEASGGECPAGMCSFRADIHRDGTVVRSDGMDQVADPVSLARLVAGMEGADWEAILARPFDGECPTAFDGQEQVYTFHAGAKPVVVASCTVAIDPAQEPFATVQAILFVVGG
jgi:hypothetical protein